MTSRYRSLLVAAVIAASVAVLAWYGTIDRPAPMPPVVYRAVVAPDRDTVYFDESVEGVPCVVLRKMSAWATTRRVVVQNAANPCLSSDGLTIYCQRHSGNSTDVLHVNCETHKERLVASLAVRADIQEVERDESRLIIAVLTYGGGAAFLSQTQTMETRNGALSAGRIGAGACFARDGAIVFCHEGNGELWIEERDGRKRKLQDSGALPQADGSGSRVLYVSNITVPYRQREWRVLELDNNTTEAVGKWESPTLSADGMSIVGLDTSLDGSIWQYDLKNRVKTRVARVPSQVYGFRAAPGGVAAISDSGGVLTIVGGTAKQMPR